MPRPGPRWTLTLCAVVAVALAGVGGMQLWRLDDLTTRSITVDGVPLLEATSTNPGDSGANQRRLSTADGVVSNLDGASDLDLPSVIDVAVGICGPPGGCR